MDESTEIELREALIADFTLRYAENRGWLKGSKGKPWDGQLTNEQMKEAALFADHSIYTWRVLPELERKGRTQLIRWESEEIGDSIESLLSYLKGKRPGLRAKNKGSKRQEALSKVVEKLPGGYDAFPLQRGRISLDALTFLCAARYALDDNQPGLEAAASNYRFHTDRNGDSQYVVVADDRSRIRDSASVLRRESFYSVKAFVGEIGLEISAEGQLEPLEIAKKVQ